MAGAGASEPLSLPALPSGLQHYASGAAQTPSRAAPSSVQHGTPSRQWGSFGGTAGLATTPHSQRHRSDLGSGEMRLFRLPMFFDADGNRIVDAVLDALDDDDTMTLSEVAADFLPRRFRVNDGDTTPATGDRTAP